MKKIHLIPIISIFLFACSLSIEERGAQIAKAEMKNYLYDVSSYKAIETVVDSAYTSIYTDMDVVAAAIGYIDLDIDNINIKKEFLKMHYNSAKSSAALWGDTRGVMSGYAKEQYLQAKEEMDDCEKQIKELDETVNARINKIRDCADKVVENQFYGWNIYHKFRCANGLGIPQISEALIIVDENMEYVYGRLILDYDDEYGFDRLKEVIDKAMNAS